MLGLLLRRILEPLLDVEPLVGHHWKGRWVVGGRERESFSLGGMRWGGAEVQKEGRRVDPSRCRQRGVKAPPTASERRPLETRALPSSQALRFLPARPRAQKREGVERRGGGKESKSCLQNASPGVGAARQPGRLVRSPLSALPWLPSRISVLHLLITRPSPQKKEEPRERE